MTSPMVPWPKESDYTEQTPYGPGMTAPAGWDYERARAEAAIARLHYLANKIEEHNQSCDEMCGLGDQEGVNCGYRPYFPRHCPGCPKRDDKLDWLDEIGPFPDTKRG